MINPKNELVLWQERRHRAGSVTAGLSMIVMGMLFLFHEFFPDIRCSFILHLWPLMVIGLGTEILLTTRKEQNFILDIPSVILMFGVTIGAFILAGAEAGIQYINLG